MGGMVCRYPVDIFHTKKPEADYVNAAVLSALQVCTHPFTVSPRIMSLISSIGTVKGK